MSEKKRLRLTKLQAMVVVAVVVIALIVGGIYYYYTSIRPAPKEKIKIGVAISMSGPFMEAASHQLNAYRLWVDEVNGKGGIYVAEYGRKLPVELIVYDDRSDPATAVKLYEKLITEDKVDLLFGPYSSAVFFAVSSVAEKYKMPILGPTASANEIYERGYNYTFIALPSVRSWAEAVLSFLEAKPELKNVVVVSSTFRVGVSFVKYVREGLEKIGRTIVFYEEYPTGTKDLTSLALKIKAANPDAVIAGGAFPDNVLLTRTLKEVGFNPKFLYLAIGTDMPEFIETLGETAEGVCGFRCFHHKLPFPGVKEFVEAYQKRYGKLPPVEAAGGYTQCQLLQAAIEKAGSLDPEKIRKALLELDMYTVFGRWRYGEKAGGRWINIYEKTYINQVQHGKYEIVWPPEYATSEMWYPKPPWK
jgi:branched-chain amino acid transport system substrate-binding protein